MCEAAETGETGDLGNGNACITAAFASAFAFARAAEADEREGCEDAEGKKSPGAANADAEQDAEQDADAVAGDRKRPSGVATRLATPFMTTGARLESVGVGFDDGGDSGKANATSCKSWPWLL